MAEKGRGKRNPSDVYLDALTGEQWTVRKSKSRESMEER